MNVKLRRAVSTALLSGLSSCSLLDPHVSLTVAERDEVFYRMASECPPLDSSGRIIRTDGKLPDGPKRLSPYCQFHGTLPGAIEYAYALSQEYDGAVESQSLLKNGLALGLIPASAAALYFGITSNHPDAILATATGGAAAFGLGSFLSSEPRQRVYISGSLALGCAILKSTPYLLDEDQYKAIGREFTQSQARLTKNMEAANIVSGALAEVDTQIAEKEGEMQKIDPSILPSGGSQSLIQSVVVSIETGRQALVDSAAVAGKALTMRMKVDHAGVELVQAVHSISEQVSREVTRTEPDVNAIRAIAVGLAGSVQSQEQVISEAAKARIPSSQPAVAAADAAAPAAPAVAVVAGAVAGAKQLTPAEQAQLAKLGAEVDALKMKRMDLTGQLSGLAAQIDADTLTLRQDILLVQPLLDQITAKEQTAAAVPACTVEPAEQTGFTITPAVSDLAMTNGESKSFIVNGALGNATGTVISGPAGGIEPVTTADGAGLKVTLTAKKPGTYIVAISDASGKGTKTINVVVAASLTLKQDGKDVGDEISVAKGKSVTIVVSDGTGELSTGIDGERVTATSKNDAVSGSVTVSADSNADTAVPHVLTITAGSETRKIKVKITD